MDDKGRYTQWVYRITCRRLVGVFYARENANT